MVTTLSIVIRSFDAMPQDYVDIISVSTEVKEGRQSRSRTP